MDLSRQSGGGAHDRIARAIYSIPGADALAAIGTTRRVAVRGPVSEPGPLTESR
jgi:hypothetical protein